jgi:hypothetical protein
MNFISIQLPVSSPAMIRETIPATRTLAIDALNPLDDAPFVRQGSPLPVASRRTMFDDSLFTLRLTKREENTCVCVPYPSNKCPKNFPDCEFFGIPGQGTFSTGTPVNRCDYALRLDEIMPPVRRSRSCNSVGYSW